MEKIILENILNHERHARENEMKRGAYLREYNALLHFMDK